MKRILILVLMGFATSLLFAQDVIVKRNGDEIKSKVLEITENTVKYKEFNFQDGPVRNININDVFMIIYENGKRETFKTPVPKPAVAEPSTYKNTATNNSSFSGENKVKRNKYKGNYVLIGTGYGNSYGGAGIKLDQRIGGLVGFGYHIGVGYFPNAPVLASFGIKFFPYKGLYLDSQFGLTGWEEYYEYYNGNETYYDSHLLYGPSFLVGGDWVWGKKVGFGFNSALGLTYNINAIYYSEISLAIDLGFIIRF